MVAVFEEVADEDGVEVEDDEDNVVEACLMANSGLNTCSPNSVPLTRINRKGPSSAVIPFPNPTVYW